MSRENGAGKITGSSEPPRKTYLNCRDCDVKLDEAVILAGYARCPFCHRAALLARNAGN